MAKKCGKQFLILNEAFKAKVDADIGVRSMFGSYSLFVDECCFGRVLNGDVYIKIIDEDFARRFSGLIGEGLRLPHHSSKTKDVGYTHYRKMDVSIRTQEIVDYITTTNFKVDNYKFGGKRPQVGSILALPNMTNMEKRYFFKGNITTSADFMATDLIDIYLACREHLPEEMKLSFMVKSYCAQKNRHHLTITTSERSVLKQTIDDIDTLIDELGEDFQHKRMLNVDAVDVDSLANSEIKLEVA